MGAVLALTLALAGTVQAASPPRARLRPLVCQPARDPAARAVSVTAVMRPVPGTVKLALRFDLLSRSRGAASFSALGGGDLGTWIEPETPTLGRRLGDVWLVNKQVVDLAAPATYRFRVSFRWIGRHGRVLGTALRRTPTCFQPELRPDLLVSAVDVAADPANPQLSDYVATIRNAGASAAGAFDVRFAPGDGPVMAQPIDGLAAHSGLRVTFVGPACSPTSRSTITVDPTGEVDDANRANNARTVVCPAAPAGASGRARFGR